MNAQTVDSGSCGTNLTWTLTGTSPNYTLTISGTGAMANYSAYSSPSNFAPWDSFRTAIKTVVINNGVTSIGNFAFYVCSGLTSVTIPESVTSIGKTAFQQCSLTSVTIPNSVTSIESGAFSSCSGLTSVTIPNSVTNIGESAFIHCSGLTSVTIGNSVTSIGERAFSSCSGLTSVTIPNSVASIGSAAFLYCISLTSINVDVANMQYCSVDGILYNKNQTTLHTYPNGKQGTSFAIPNSVTSIGDVAFAYCSSLTSVTIPNSVTSIGDIAFAYCSGLTSVTIPNSVTSIGGDAFYSCSGLTSVTIGNSVTSIGRQAFLGCNGLTSIYVHRTTPASLGHIALLNVDKNTCTLYVPAGSTSAYKAAEQWKDFINIVEFTPPEQYTIAISAGTGISATTGAGTYNLGTTATVGCTVTSGYTFDGWYEGSTKVSSSQSYNFTVTAARTLQARAIQTYTITVSAGSGGTISPSGIVNVNQGGSQTFIFTPDADYEIDQVLIDGTNNATAVSAGSYTFTNVTANHTVSVSFKQKAAQTFTITTSAGSGGGILPNGNVTVNHGGEQTFVFTPDADYEIANVWIDGVDNSAAVAMGGYTFTNVVAHHTIIVSFKQRAAQTCTITASAGSGGNISPSGNVNISQGGSQTFYFTPATGYEIDKVQVDGTNNVSAVANGTYTFPNVTTNHTIAVTFKQKQYTITVSAGANGSISPASNQTVNYGDSRTFTFTPNAGYEINKVLVDGVNDASAVANGTYTFANVTANHTLAVAFGKTCLPNLVVQIWDDVLSLVNDTERTGYTFVAYQWLKNDEWLAGETSAYLYFPEAAKDYNAEYTLLLTTTTGQELQTCPVRLRAVKADLRTYPNPTTGIVTVEDATIQSGTKIDIYNINGQLVKQCTATQNRTTVDISTLPRGTYILRVNNRQGKIIKN
ncbi:hypothetical protein AGMMS4957_04470 [Bacteroidia bacterium]|nr:hypothetical protein AGMMS4957_04470 [Bacteroidia bacterium]